MRKPAAGWSIFARNALGEGRSWALLALAVVLSACGDAREQALDKELRSLAVTTLGLTGNPATPRGAQRVVPDTDPLVKLGQLLFFSQTLASGYDVSCGTCHHTDFGGSDGLSISVGVVSKNASAVGPGREIDPERDLDPNGDGGPNMHRNSITTFNAALFDRALMFDARVFVLDEETASGGFGQLIRTPESGRSADLTPLDGLMQFAMKGPIVNNNWMRGFLYSDLATPTDYRERIVQRLRGTVDTQYNPKANGPANWLARFRAAFDQPGATAEQVITVLNVQRALAAYIQSQIFVDTPWRGFLEGDNLALSKAAKQGARLFLASDKEGGLGCNGCHAGNRLTDEAFHNVAFPQFGRGPGNSERRDMGRWRTTSATDDAYAFRTPSLLNVARTAPYGHVGAFDSLADVLAYHANPRRAMETYDFSLSQLAQFRNGAVLYPEAKEYTRDTLLWPNFASAEALLPGRFLSSKEISQLVAFLEALTDRCVAEPACIGKWAPSAADDPDGHTLIRNQPLGTPEHVDAQRPGDYSPKVPLNLPTLPARPTFADVQNCPDSIATAANTGLNGFTRQSDAGFGLADRHGYSVNAWFDITQSTPEVAMSAGGVSAAYLDEDCWPDLAFTGGDVSGMVFYRNNAGTGFSPLNLLTGDPEREFTSTASADLNGDYRRELFLGNVKPGTLPIYSPNGAGQYDKVADLAMSSPTFGMSFAPLNATGNLYMYLAHWFRGTGIDGSAPALWRSDGQNLYPWDRIGRTTSAFMDKRFNFTPKFADFNGDGHIDLAIASDFHTTSVLRNVPDTTLHGWHFENETRYSPITDEYGMGSTLLDIDNDGKLEWFVTAIYARPGAPVENVGYSGNRLYRNTSTTGRLAFTDITDQAGVRDGSWGWGACSADFNNDGFIDLFHVNGFGYIPDDVAADALSVQQLFNNATLAEFQNKPPRLFINNADGTFSDAAEAWGIAVPSEGRGVVCFDYERDGDVDIVVFDHSRTPQFFENHGGNGPGHRFLGVRLVGAASNTDAIGASVHVTANLGARGMQTQFRQSEANSNFNSQNLPDLYFGLGSASVVTQVRVVWPGGTELSCENVPINTFLVLDQRAGPGGCPPTPP